MTTFGIDVSHHQPDFNFDAAAAEGIKFCYIKCSEGRELRDERWPEYRDHALSAGLYTAGYHFLRSDSPVEDQARNCVGWLGRNTPLILDVEEDKSPLSRPTLKDIDGFIEAARELGTEVSMVYLPPWYAKSMLKRKETLKHLPPLIASDYGHDAVGVYREIYPGDDSDRWKAYGDVTPTILQYGSRASVASQRVDVNAFRGPAAKLAKWFRSPPGENTLSLDEIVNPNAPEEEQISIRQCLMTAWRLNDKFERFAEASRRRVAAEVRRDEDNLAAIKAEIAKMNGGPKLTKQAVVDDLIERLKD